MANRIYVTGDCHAVFRRFSTDNFPEQKQLDKDDFVIICGDAGFLWTNDKEGRYWLDWMSEKSFTTLFVDGNHENFDALYAHPVQLWHGGQARLLSPSVIHLTRGQIFDIAGKRFFTFGGAQSHDIEGGILDMNDPLFHKKRRHLRLSGAHYRINRLNWWQEELPSDAEYAEGLRNLEKHNWQTDYIVTHAAPAAIAAALNPQFGRTPPEQYFDTIRQKCRYTKWLFGHYHEDRYLSAGEIALCDRILRLE